MDLLSNIAGRTYLPFGEALLGFVVIAVLRMLEPKTGSGRDGTPPGSTP